MQARTRILEGTPFLRAKIVKFPVLTSVIFYGKNIEESEKHSIGIHLKSTK